LPHEDSLTTPRLRPGICIGIDSFHTPTKLVQEAVNHFEVCGYNVKVNNLFSGTLTPMDYYKLDNRVQGVMIEVNRNLYRNYFDVVKGNITQWLETLK
jgi:N-formylglutamate amidohydrolase